jgi:predicted RecB family nuclease
MLINNEILYDFIHCPYKSYRKSKRDSGIFSEYQLFYNQQKEIQQTNFKNFCSQQTDINIKYSVLYKNSSIDITLDAVEFIDKKHIIPILITPFEKVSRTDKLFVALQAAYIQNEFHLQVDNCKVIFGKNMRQTKFKITSFTKATKKIIGEINKTLSNSLPPSFVRNLHCQICEFQLDCMEKLVERDDLSLLTGLKSKEIQQKNSQGFFSVKQLSYTFRPKKNPYRKRNFLPELKALAIRENKTFIQEIPTLPTSQTEIYLDIEGLPDRNFYYLIGTIIKTQDSEQKFSFWAKNADEEMNIFTAFIALIEPLDEYTIYHYGSYEIQALKTISKRLSQTHQKLLKQMIDNSFNLLTIFTHHIYPPTYSNGLKEIAKFLRFEWTEKNASGLQSIVWRYNWKFSQKDEWKNRLIQYNLEDCEALMRVKHWIHSIDKTDANKQFTSELKQENIFKWGITNYFLKEFEEVNEKAYFDYQREHIFLRTEKKVYKAISKAKAESNKYNKIDKQANLFPNQCMKCGNKKIKIIRSAKKIQIDLIFMKQGIKKQVTEFEGGAYLCANCKKQYVVENMRTLPRYSYNLMLWAVNQKMQYRLSSENISNILKDSFKIDASNTQISHFKEVIASKYVTTYQEIIENMTNSNLIQADETIARIKEIDGYVWVFANYDSVYYQFRETREPEFLKELLKDFKGVLVSDFYTGYDSLECKQQKCLVHLIRDMNEDFLKHQFDEELKLIVKGFGVLLRSIVATVDKYGLKKFHLNKHNKDVEQFYKDIIAKSFESELAISYQKRLLKYREKIFLFINYDNIPWNNNNAEHSIKPFAKWRKKISKSLTKQNIENHLILLSILQTCKYRGINFFEFLKSGKKSILKYSENHK